MPVAVKRYSNMAEVLKSLGGISPKRVVAWPPPGQATEQDVIALLEAGHKRICELINGILVEKDMGAKESGLAAVIIHWISTFLDEHDRGIVFGADGTLRLFGKRVRIPDVSFISWTQLPMRELPDEPIPSLHPDLAVEVISRGNTKGEMRLKLRDYFRSGCRLVWFIYPETRTAEIYTSPTASETLTESDSLLGGEVLPGFKLPLKKLFARLPQSPARKNGKPRRKS